MLRTILASVFLLFSDITIAMAVGSIERPSPVIDVPGSTSELIAKIIAYAIGLTAIISVIGVTWGGIQMVLSVGEDEKQKKARYIIIYSLVGVALSGLAYGIVEVISSLKVPI